MQFGPRIRVGGALGHAGQAAKIGIGKLAQPVGKVVSFVNPMLGAAISTAGDVLDTSDGKFNVGKAGKNAVMQYGIGKLAGKIPGGDKIMGKVGAVRDKLPSGARELGTAVMQNASGQHPHEAMDEQLPPVQIGHGPNGDPIYNPGQGPSGGAAEHGRFRSIMDYLGGHKDDILDYGQAAEHVYDKYRQVKAQDELAKIAKADYLRRAPLRTAGMATMLDDSQPDDSGVFSVPEQRYRRVNVGGMG